MVFTYKHLQKEAKYRLGMFMGYLFKVFRCKKLINFENFETRQNTMVSRFQVEEGQVTPNLGK